MVFSFNMSELSDLDKAIVEYLQHLLSQFSDSKYPLLTGYIDLFFPKRQLLNFLEQDQDFIVYKQAACRLRELANSDTLHYLEQKFNQESSLAQANQKKFMRRCYYALAVLTALAFAFNSYINPILALLSRTISLALFLLLGGFAIYGVHKHLLEYTCYVRCASLLSWAREKPSLR